MAREAMVTRTMKSTEVTILCLDTVTCEPSNKTITLPRTYKDEAEMLKEAKKLEETPDFILTKVVAYEVHEALYGMSEADFIKSAKILPPRAKVTE